MARARNSTTPSRNTARWRDDVEGAALRQLFDSGEADPNDTATTDHMNEVWQNYQDLFGHITAPRNFHTNFRRTAAEYLTVNGMNGTRRQAARTNAGGNNDTGAGNVDNTDDDNGPEGKFTYCLTSCGHDF